jgi:hypothetical protein
MQKVLDKLDKPQVLYRFWDFKRHRRFINNDSKMDTRLRGYDTARSVINALSISDTIETAKFKVKIRHNAGQANCFIGKFRSDGVSLSSLR